MDYTSISCHPNDDWTMPDNDELVQHPYGRKRWSSTNAPSLDLCNKRQKELMGKGYRTCLQARDAIAMDIPQKVEEQLSQSMEMESLPGDSLTASSHSFLRPLHQQSTHEDSIYQQIVHQFSIGSGSLLLDDQHLLDPAIQEDVLKASRQDQLEWLDQVVYARQRAKAWDSTHYRNERNALKHWLR